MKHGRSLAILISLFTVFYIIVTVIFLKTNGVFNVIDRQKSPDGKITSTIYNKTKSSDFKENGVTVFEHGAVHGITSYPNATYICSSWSTDSRYHLVMLIQDGIQVLHLLDHDKNINTSLLSAFSMAMYGHKEFDDAPPHTHSSIWKQIDYEFVGWDGAKLCLAFSYTKTSGEIRKGRFWYDCDTREIFDIEIE